jgi:hypothetical protein
LTHSLGMLIQVFKPTHGDSHAILNSTMLAVGLMQIYQ